MKRIIMSVFTIFAMVAVVAGGTHAVFSDSDTITGNTLSAADITITLVEELEGQGVVQKPIGPTNLLPGEWSDWYHIGVRNDGTRDSNVFMHGTSFSGTGGAICANTRLVVEANSGSGWFVKYDGPATGIHTPNNRQQLKVAPLETNDTLEVRQRVQLNENAPNSAQGQTCTWNEVFVLEGAL
jgi:predicted ribosomally synthesized peptide with SipW-like signal peptide